MPCITGALETEEQGELGAGWRQWLNLCLSKLKIESYLYDNLK